MKRDLQEVVAGEVKEEEEAEVAEVVEVVSSPWTSMIKGDHPTQCCSTEQAEVILALQRWRRKRKKKKVFSL